ncbi:hypothetical protein HII36_33585 [Nonomuraea sp. NN258]|uniref:hypothetical protein n=1 Tax=Nonomuraea antri TaxID=2730852 RepID=UPI0015681F36|nr:hypothetical protein [Nonomuraea antri]NRQ36733.1 hypothetical protein [Nonomuraea antri]
MDVEAEILQLKLRTADLETATRCGGGDEHGQRCPHGAILAEISLRLHSLQADLTATAIGIIEARADVADIKIDLDRDLAALGIEHAGLRAQLHENAKAARSDLAKRFDSLRCEMIELGLRLDRLDDDEVPGPGG